MDNKHKLAFKKQNYMLMLAGIVLLVIGFITMTLDNTTHGFGFLGITLGPILVVAGFIVQFFAIMYKPKENKPL